MESSKFLVSIKQRNGLISVIVNLSQDIQRLVIGLVYFVVTVHSENDTKMDLSELANIIVALFFYQGMAPIHSSCDTAEKFKKLHYELIPHQI